MKFPTLQFLTTPNSPRMMSGILMIDSKGASTFSSLHLFIRFVEFWTSRTYTRDLVAQSHCGVQKETRPTLTLLKVTVGDQLNLATIRPAASRIHSSDAFLDTSHTHVLPCIFCLSPFSLTVFASLSLAPSPHHTGSAEVSTEMQSQL